MSCVNFEDSITKIDHVVQMWYQTLAQNGILCGLKRFVFYAYKDAQSKKQGVTKNLPYGVKCIFISIESRASFDLNNDGYGNFKNIAEAHNYLMHPTVPTLANAMSRLQLALSETTQIINDFTDVHVEEIDDIYCRDEKGEIVCDVNKKALVDTDGVGSISKNLAKGDCHQGCQKAREGQTGIPVDDASASLLQGQRVEGSSSS